MITIIDGIISNAQDHVCKERMPPSQKLTKYVPQYPSPETNELT